jgi:hypothetical protein
MTHLLHTRHLAGALLALATIAALLLTIGAPGYTGG